MTMKETKTRALPDSEPRMAHLGKVIRASREGRMTVEELAEAAGVSGGLISQLERGIGNPSFNTLMRLSRALGFAISELFEGEGYEPERRVVRTNERRKLTSEGLTQELLTPDANRKLGMVRTVVPSGYSSEDTPMTHPGEEAFHILEGELEVTLDGHHYVLSEGDTVSFDSATPHAYSNRTARPVVFMGASTPPTTARYY
ncbi:XRE family transcriptional regulator [Salinibacterium sp. TMP30]|uniref:helix-turn-helix domain-containing protein n=1 Tax=Salinibacterium sp. TMP30 TaxID=3138237 RepID=UPI00313A0D40